MKIINLLRKANPSLKVSCSAGGQILTTAMKSALEKNPPKSKSILQGIDKDVSDAIKTNAPLNKYERQLSTQMEEKIAVAVNGVKTKDSFPIDVYLTSPSGKNIGIECKRLKETNLRGQIRIKESSRIRKYKWAEKENADLYTIINDDRTGKYYLSEGIKDFDVDVLAKQGKEIKGGLKELKNIFKGK